MVLNDKKDQRKMNNDFSPYILLHPNRAQYK